MGSSATAKMEAGDLMISDVSDLKWPDYSENEKFPEVDSEEFI